MWEILIGKLLVKSAGIHHYAYFGFVKVLNRLVAFCLRCTAEDGLAVGQIAFTHQHRLTPGVGDGDTSDGKVEHLWIGQHISCQRGP